MLIVVTFFEPPLWAVRAAARGFPGLYSSDEYPSFQLPTLGPFAGCAIEVSLFAGDSLVGFVAQQRLVEY